MATIRMAASAGAALIALMAIVPAASPAQAPLQLVPGANQAKRAAPVATAKTTKAANNKNTASKKSPNKAAQAAASRKNARQAVAAAPSSPKTVRTSSKKTANNSVASRRQGEAKTNVQRARAANSQRVARTAISEPSPVPSPTAPTPRIFAQDDGPSPADNVMRGSNSISLVARLPWWRNDRLREVEYGSVAAEDAVMAAAAAWLAANGGELAADHAPGQTLTLASPEEAIEVADAGQLNDIDLAADEIPPPPSPTFLQSLMALLGGIAAAAVASARFLFV